jgi:molybdate transport system ATP-binding protein
MGIEFKLNKKLEHFEVDVDCRFESGILVIQGESGAGKTTILNCIAGLIAPEMGRINVNGRIAFDHRNKINLPAKSRNIGYVFQNYVLFPNISVRKNILYGVKNKAEYKNKSEKAEMLEYVDYIIDTFRIGHIVDKYPRRISGGEKQRVALARAIATKPELLLLDEPFSALDKNTKEIIYKEFIDFKKNFQIPTILITHNEEESKAFGDSKIMIKEGKVI